MGQKYYTVGTVPKSNTEIVQRGKIDTPNTQTHSLVWFRHFIQTGRG